MSKKERNFKSTLLIVETILVDNKEIWIDMDISFGEFKTEKHAKLISENAEVFFSSSKGQPMIRIEVEIPDSKRVYYVYDNDIAFKKVKDEKVLSMGNPIDVCTQEGKDQVLATINNDGTTDPNYTVRTEDMESFKYSLEELSKQFRDNYSLQCVACGVIDIRKTI